MLGKIRTQFVELRSLARDLLGAQRQTNAILRQLARDEIYRTERFRDKKRLLGFGWKAFSQTDEDGMIAEIFHRIGSESKFFIEFGIETGIETNTTLLLMSGWSGCWIEGSKSMAAKARQAAQGYPVKVVNAVVSPANADELLGSLAEKPVDLLSIDIDSVDYWVWEAVESIKPRLVVIEYNATIPPDLTITVPADHSGWDGPNYFGASLGALEKLGARKGYNLVGCSPAGVNAFFVRSDLTQDRFAEPFTALNHYEPARFWLSGPAGHRPRLDRWETV